MIAYALNNVIPVITVGESLYFYCARICLKMRFDDSARLKQ